MQVFGSVEQESDSETEDQIPESQPTYQALTTERQSDEIRNREPLRKTSEEQDTPPIDHTPSRWTSFRNRVRSRAVTNARGAKPSAPVPWKLLLRRREVWAIILSQVWSLSLLFECLYHFRTGKLTDLNYSHDSFVQLLASLSCSRGHQPFISSTSVSTWEKLVTSQVSCLLCYCQQIRQINNDSHLTIQSCLLSVVPSIAQGIVGLSSGYLGDKAVRSWNWTTLSVRRVSQVVGGLSIATALILAVTIARSAYGAMALITAGMALNGFTMIGASAYQHDICPQYAGFIFALGNSAGTIPGIIGVLLAGLLVDKNGHTLWGLIWSMVAVFYCIGCMSFVLLSTNKKIHT